MQPLIICFLESQENISLSKFWSSSLVELSSEVEVHAPYLNEWIWIMLDRLFSSIYCGGVSLEMRMKNGRKVMKSPNYNKKGMETTSLNISCLSFFDWNLYALRTSQYFSWNQEIFHIATCFAVFVRFFQHDDLMVWTVVLHAVSWATVRISFKYSSAFQTEKLIF